MISPTSPSLLPPEKFAAWYFSFLSSNFGCFPRIFAGNETLMLNIPDNRCFMFSRENFTGYAHFDAYFFFPLKA